MPPRRRREPLRPRPANYLQDPLTGQTAELQKLQPFQARKEYVCPGCNQEIRVGTGHAVVVPMGAADLRRHWHSPCLERASRHGLR
jgi:hypothetical protein